MLYHQTRAKEILHVAIGQYIRTFTAPTIYSAGSTLHSVAMGDLNGDEKPDVVVAHYRSNSNAFNGRSINQMTYSIDSHPRSMILDDVDIDGANYDANNVGILLNIQQRQVHW